MPAVDDSEIADGSVSEIAAPERAVPRVTRSGSRQQARTQRDAGKNDALDGAGSDAHAGEGRGRGPDTDSNSDAGSDQDAGSDSDAGANNGITNMAQFNACARAMGYMHPIDAGELAYAMCMIADP